MAAEAAAATTTTAAAAAAAAAAAVSPKYKTADCPLALSSNEINNAIKEETVAANP